MTQYYGSPQETELRAAKAERDANRRNAITSALIGTVGTIISFRAGAEVLGAGIATAAGFFTLREADDWIGGREHVRFLVARAGALAMHGTETQLPYTEQTLPLRDNERNSTGQ